jgi:hypothetical protein
MCHKTSDKAFTNSPYVPPERPARTKKMNFTELDAVGFCHTRVSKGPKPGYEIITKCAGIKSHTYDDSWYRSECHNFNI